jgi:hypothetical protein
MEINSSNVIAMGYDPKTKVLTIEFVGGRKYKYPNISRQRYAALRNSSSIGAYVNNKLKDLPSKKV